MNDKQARAALTAARRVALATGQPQTIARNGVTLVTVQPVRTPYGVYGLYKSVRYLVNASPRNIADCVQFLTEG